MNKTALYSVILLAAAWIVLREDFTLLTVATGIVIGAGCLYFCHRYIPLPKPPHIHPFRLAIYVIYLVGQVYVAGLSAIKIILTDAHVEIVEIKTQITDKFLRTMLVNSITLVPGSVSLELRDDAITVLWLKKAGARELENADELIKGKLERMLIKAQK